ncbi:AT-hook motif nuclear-localized protein 10 [Elaeis guineensis]|uniref:AT-hook motif nuclear-localized protein n=1 Tax=Elaeis guineensis var. tenera TaxID=51953 RepID=A0A6I9QNI4_ELAGV|nr:AT-hook motif nuclear-localized protein 10 [Elaeis guineensis]
MEGRESVVVSGSPEVGGGDAGGAAKDSASSTPSPSPTPSPPPGGAVVPPVPGMGMGIATGMSTGVGSGSGSEDLARKKRGRPRKYGPDGSGMALALSPTTASSPFSPIGGDFSGKRGRGRPPGSGKRQLLAALGEWFAYSAGGNFTPHVVTIATGEDVAAKILSFSQKGPRAICILSANGAISNVTLRQPGSSGGTLTYEGRFEILSLSGSFTIAENGGVRSRTGGISVSLAGPDGRVVGGGVAGLLLAASPIQVVVGSFIPNTFKEHKRKAIQQESTFSPIPIPIPTSTGVLTTARPISQANPDDECETPASTVPGQQSHGDAENRMSNPPNLNFSSFRMTGWHGQQSSEHKPSPDINICLPGE